MAGIMLAQFLVSIDRTIISTAIPYVTHEFQSTPDIGWYGSAYLLTACAFQPMFGRVFTLFSVKEAYLTAMSLFEIGSLLCGAAPNSIVLIVGRAIAGLGSAGILTGSFVIVGTAAPLQSRPMLMAVVGTMFGVGATTGPLLGGVFTDLVSWRWCFYVNLPIGGATVLAMVLFFHPRRSENARRGFIERLLELDIAGNVLFLGAAIMFFLALEYTTQGVAWNNVRVIGLLGGSFQATLFFIAWQWRQGDAALMPPRIITQRTVAASCGMAFMIYAALINLTYFLPVWFQAIRGVSAIQSGVNMIPYFVVNAGFSLVAGAFVSKTGYVTPPAVIGSAIGTIGLGLMTLLRVDMTTAQWVGYQVLTSAGFGISIQQGFMAVQTVLEEKDMAIATAAVVASQSLGGAVFLPVGNSIFHSQLIRATAAGLLDGLDIKKLIDSGAASFRHLVPAEKLPAMLEIYNKALTKVFTVSIPLGALAAIISFFIEWKSVKSGKKED
ncbi:major facilitator superfamily domain-containing protein [Corynascus novoguineensis]|uniref:Major facilitator superfamily domain-containing protein n=1 Tax=Corynascus novoguineensis TaxID=1126955 RepID=A0AAN7HJ79_9PEZI|nr:major facilitator superfamily domain-containing protein [Corynascus novoguineensis]